MDSEAAAVPIRTDDEHRGEVETVIRWLGDSGPMLANATTVWTALSAVAATTTTLVTVAFVVAGLKQLRLMRDQQRLQVLPLPVVHIDRTSDGTLVLDVSNVATVPAFDVDVHLLWVYYEDELPLRDFLRSHIQPSAQELYDDLVPTDVDGSAAYALVDYFSYSVTPPRRGVRASIYCPVESTTGADVVIQFRDALGTNYWTALWFTLDPPLDRYRLSSSEPAGYHPSPRFELSRHTVKSSDGSPLPEVIGKFAKLYEASFSAFLLNGVQDQFEDRGAWYLL